MNANTVAFTEKGEQVGMLTSKGELVVYSWGRSYPTGIFPIVKTRGHVVSREVFSSRRMPKVVIECERFTKAAKNGETFIVTLFGERALCEINTKAPEVTTKDAARAKWAVI